MNRKKEALREYKIRQLKKGVNPPADSPASNTMYNVDPAAKAEQEQATTETQESAAQDKAMEVDAEEGTTEG